MDFSGKCFKVGSRESQLALIQTEWTIAKLKELHPNTTFEIVKMKTVGDKVLDKALSKIGEKSLFTKELELALLQDQVHFVVHSLKDLPTQLPPKLLIAAIAEREDPRDAVLIKKDLQVNSLSELPSNSVVGTSSLRRVAQLSAKFPHLSFMDVRGNLNTRLKKLDDPNGPYSALVLATAGITRMGWRSRISQFLEWEDCMHAVGQGALAVECHEDNAEILELLKSLNHTDTYLKCLAERSFLRTLEGGCSVPVGVCSCIEEVNCQRFLTLKGSVWSLDGKKCLIREVTRNLADCNDCIQTNEESMTSLRRVDVEYGSPEVASFVGASLGKTMLTQGAQEILDEVRKTS